MNMTKEMRETKALQEIRAIVGRLGMESYVGAALNGALELADSNIQEKTFDTAQYFMEKSWELEKRLFAITKERATLRGRVAAQDNKILRPESAININQIKKYFSEYNIDREGERSTPKAERARDEFMDFLADILTRKEYIKIEAAINDYSDAVEETAFTGGFLCATGMELTEEIFNVAERYI